jgi:hypothetical protein
VRTGLRAVEGDEDAGLDLLGQFVLERRGQAIGFVPRIAEHVGQEALDDAVPADGADGLAATGGGEVDALVEDVLDQAPVGEALHGRRHRGWAHLELLGQVAGVRGLVALRQPVDGLERLALGLRQLHELHVGCGAWIS